MKELPDPVLLLAAWRRGDEAARDQLFELIHEQLMVKASFLLKDERDDISLCTGDLVNEAIVRMLQSAELDIEDKRHLIALSGRVMRQVLWDAAKRKKRLKRKAIHVAITQAGDRVETVDLDFLVLESALVRLNIIDPERAAIVEMRYYAGMTHEEIATVQGVSKATVKRRWESARLWLEEAIRNDF